jgi:hypothetical protein
MKRVEPFLKIEPVLDYEPRPAPLSSRLRQWFVEVIDEIDRTGWILLLCALSLFVVCCGLFFSGGMQAAIGVRLMVVVVVLINELYNRCLKQGKL